MNITALGSWIESWGKTRHLGSLNPVSKCIRVFSPAGPGQQRAKVAALGPSGAWRSLASLPRLPERPRCAEAAGDMDRNLSPPPPSRDEDEEAAAGDCIGSTSVQQRAPALRRPQRVIQWQTRLEWAPLLSPGCRPASGSPPCPGSRRPFDDPLPRPSKVAPALASRLSTCGTLKLPRPLFVPQYNGSVP